MNPIKATQLEQAIATLPRIALGVMPTPLEPMSRLSDTLAGPPLYIKRDDLTGLAFGGNKTRMLELSLAHAQSKGADVIVTGAAVQSNYCRQMAAACAKLGIELHLVLRPERPIDSVEVQGNHLLQRLCGAHVTVLPDNNREAQQAALQAKADELQSSGRTVYRPRLPDTIDLDAIAYAEAALEIVRQCDEFGIEPDYLYCAAADTTQAGLVLGLTYVESPIRVRAFNPLKHSTSSLSDMTHMANQAARRLGLDMELRDDNFSNDDSFVGERYGIPTEAGLAAIGLVARTEGILLDPVYTGKAMAALINHIRAGDLGIETPILFLHTGGAPALFGYAQELMAA